MSQICKKVILLSHNLQFEYADKLIQKKITERIQSGTEQQQRAPKYAAEDTGVTPAI